MKKIYSAVLMVVMFVGTTIAQNKFINKSQLIDFFMSTTYVVIDNNPSVGFNIAIKGAMEKYWKVTPFKVISMDDFDKARMDKKSSFMFLAKENATKGNTAAFYDFLVLAMGDTSSNLSNMPEIVNIPLSYSEVDENAYIDKIGLIVQFIQLHVNNMKEARNHIFLRNLKYYNTNIKEIKTKTLLVEESDLAEEVNSIEKIKMYYPYDVKIVDSDEITKAIDEKRPNTIILHQISPGAEDYQGRSYHFLLGTDDAKMYYYNFFNITTKQPTGFLAKDFKRLAAGF